MAADEKVRRSSTLIRNNLHYDWMAKYSLGRHKRSLSKQKIQEFTKVYADFVIQAYAGLARNYSNVKAVVKRVSKVDNDMFIVSMEILKTDSKSPVQVEYLVHKLANEKNFPYNVGDIITEGVSILNSQKSEFTRTQHSTRHRRAAV